MNIAVKWNIRHGSRNTKKISWPENQKCTIFQNVINKALSEFFPTNLGRVWEGIKHFKYASLLPLCIGHLKNTGGVCTAVESLLNWRVPFFKNQLCNHWNWRKNILNHSTWPKLCYINSFISQTSIVTIREHDFHVLVAMP